MQPDFDRAALQQLFTGLTDRIPQLVWTAGDDGRWTWSSARWSAYTGLSDEASQGFGWQTAIHPSDRAAMVSGWREASARGEIDVDHRLLGADRSGNGRWFNTQSRPVADSRGEGTIWLGTCTDIDDEKRLRPRPPASLHQFEHRAVNVVALTRLVSRRMARASQSLEDYMLHLDSRLGAIAQMQTMLLHDPFAGVDLGGLVAEKLLAHALHESEDVRVVGPAVRLRGSAADLVCLALHELAMNAVEHGTLAMPSARLLVTWTLEAGVAGDGLRLEWRESGMTMAHPRLRRRGFGVELIERILMQQLGAQASLGFAPDGVHCVIALPAGRDVFVPDASGLDLRRFG